MTGKYRRGGPLVRVGDVPAPSIAAEEVHSCGTTEPYEVAAAELTAGKVIRLSPNLATSAWNVIGLARSKDSYGPGEDAMVVHLKDPDRSYQTWFTCEPDDLIIVRGDMGLRVKPCAGCNGTYVGNHCARCAGSMDWRACAAELRGGADR